MKRLIIAGMFLFVTFAMSAVDIKMKDGKVLRNAEILNKTPIGFDIAYTNKAGTDIVRNVLYRDVEKAQALRMGYDPEKAKAYRQQVKKWIAESEARRKRIEENREEWMKNHEKRHHLDHKKTLGLKEIENYGSQVHLHIITPQGDGVVAWADAPDATVTTGHFGKIFVYGLSAPNGAFWAGTIYPVGKVYGNYPAYAISPELAYGFAKQ